MSRTQIRAASVLAAVLLVGAASSWALAQENPSAAETEKWRRNGPCGDPWISLAVSVAKTTSAGPGRADGDECNTENYHGGRWESYKELLGYVQAKLGLITVYRYQGATMAEKGK
jgi:hypothetical protein